MWFWTHDLFIFLLQNYLVSIVDGRHTRWGAFTVHLVDRRPSHATIISVIGGKGKVAPINFGSHHINKNQSDVHTQQSTRQKSLICTPMTVRF